MSKAKPSLLDQVRQLPSVKTDCRNWWALLRAHDPDVYSQVCEVIQDFIRGGDAFEVFRYASNMNRFLSGRDKSRPGPNLIGNVSDCAFRRFVTYLKENPNG